MEAKELRIENFVHSPYDGHVIKVNAGDIFLMANGHHREARFEPIELTEEWLLKFGYGVDREFDHHFIDNTSIKNEVLRYSTYSKLFTIEGDLGDVIEIPLQYVHQLQNLYFALTGEELKIKES